MQVARIFANQKSMAEVMRTWHIGAYNFAFKNKAGIIALASNCSISPVVATGVTACTGFQVTSADFPAGYNFTDYQWYTLVTSGSPSYVITYVKTANANDLIAQPNIGYTVGDLLNQMKNADIDRAHYGTISSGTLTTGALTGTPPTTPITYTNIPAALNSVLNGAVAMISIL
jgi:hypothetical protein